MGFYLIKGTFVPKIGDPDGDSVRFIADNIENWDLLEGRGDDPGRRDSMQLRFEGIDALEKDVLHPIVTEAIESMKRLIGYQVGADEEPRGYLLAKRFEGNGRPVCFVFAGDADEADASDIFLDAARLRISVNYLQVQAGFAYPLFYNTLFKVLRETLAVAWQDARTNGRGYCPVDASMTGVTVNGRGDLDDIRPIWPKMWRRLEEYYRRRDSSGNFPHNLDGFLAFLRRSNERADDLTTFEQKSIEHFFGVEGNKVKMLVAPEFIRVVSSV